MGGGYGIAAPLDHLDLWFQAPIEAEPPPLRQIPVYAP